MSDLVALGKKLAIGFGRVSVQEARINRVVDHFQLMGWDTETFSISFLVKLETARMRSAPAQHPPRVS